MGVVMQSVSKMNAQELIDTARALVAGALYAWGVLLTPALGVVLMSASTVIVAINARLLQIKR